MTADAANTVLAQVEPAHDEIRAVFARQQAFAPRLRHASAAERLARLERLRKALLARREQIQRAAAADFRKPPEEVELSEIFPVLHEITHVRRHLRRWMKPKWVRPTLAMLGTRAEIRYEPKGVCLIISSWNYPFNLSFGPLVSAIAAGNTVILKPSELTPHCSRLIREIVEEAFPPEEVAVFEGGVEVASALLSLPFNHIFFTGSPAVGKVVMEAAARHLASVTLELGGKSPAIVDASANLDKTVRNLVWSKFANNGQTCIAPDHVYVHASVRAEFLDKLKARIRRVYGADAAAQRSSPDYCRIVNARHFERLRGLLEDALQRGARLVTGGELVAEECFIAPTVLVDVNGRPKPLALYVYAEDRAVAEQVLGNTSAGGSCVNHSLVHFLHGNLPFGGVNHSGLGNAHGVFGFRAFSHERAVLVDRYSSTHLLFPPYTARARALIRLVSRFLA